jgi:hypothetical protein
VVNVTLETVLVSVTSVIVIHAVVMKLLSLLDLKDQRENVDVLDHVVNGVDLVRVDAKGNLVILDYKDLKD